MLSFYLSSFKKIFSLVKKVLLVVIVFFAVISLFVYFINKDKPKITFDPVKKNREEIYKVINDPKMNKSKEGKITIALYRATMCGMIGEACSNNPSDGDKNFDKSIFGFMTNLIVLPYAHPPASGVYWAYSGLQNAGFIPKSYAAEGIGFASIKGYAKIWSIFRNLAYLLLVIVIIAIGFMIMFRMKLNPQTIISVENALPRIVIALILITFSFSIAGFLIDIMYVIIALGIAALTQTGIGNLNPGNMLDLQNKYAGATMSDIWPYGGGGSAFSVGAALFNVLPGIIELPLRGIVSYFVALLLSKIIFNFGPLGTIAKALENVGIEAATFGFNTGKLITNILLIILEVIGFSLLLPFIPGWIIGVLILLTLAFFIFRVFFLLLTSYIKIILFIIFSPILLLFEAIPGNNAFGFWIKNLFAELLSFPIVVLITLVGYAVVNVNSASSQAFALPFLGGFSSEDLSVLVGLGLVLVTPDLIKTVKGLLGIKDLPVSFGLGTFFSGVSAPIGGAMGLVGGYGSIALAFPKLRGFIGDKLGKFGQMFTEPPHPTGNG